MASSRVSFLAATPTIPFFPLQERNQTLNHNFFEHDLSSTPRTFSYGGRNLVMAQHLLMFYFHDYFRSTVLFEIISHTL